MKTAVIINPIAGHWKPGSNKNRISKAFRKYGIKCDIFETQSADDGIRLGREAIESGYETIIAAGGDGTINEVVNGIAGSDVNFGIIPVGSVNVLARDLSIPLSVEGSVECISKCRIKRIDVGVAQDRYFTLMAGFGFDAETVSNVYQQTKDIIGSSAYVLKGISTLATYNASEITLEMVEQSYTTSAFLVVVANVSTYTYSLKIAPFAVVDDGILDICVFEKPQTDKFGFAGQIRDIISNRQLQNEGIKYFRTSSVRVKSVPDVPVQIDGDFFGTTPMDIGIVPSALNMIIPPE